jgi:hypothetical protein
LPWLNSMANFLSIYFQGREWFHFNLTWYLPFIIGLQTVFYYSKIHWFTIVQLHNRWHYIIVFHPQELGLFMRSWWK